MFPFLKMGVTFAIFHLLGTSPVDNDRFIRWVNGLEREYAASLRIPGGGLSQPSAFLCFKDISSLSTKIRLTQRKLKLFVVVWFFLWVGGFSQIKSLSLNVSHFRFFAMLVKKVQGEFAFLVFFILPMFVVTEIGTDSFKGSISLMQFRNLVGIFLFSNNKSF